MDTANLYPYIMQDRCNTVKVSFRTKSCNKYYTTTVPHNSLLVVINKYSDIVIDEDIITVIKYNNGDISINDVEHVIEFVSLLRYYGVYVRNEQMILSDVLYLFPNIDLLLVRAKTGGCCVWNQITGHPVTHNNYYNCTANDVIHSTILGRDNHKIVDFINHNIYYVDSFNLYEHKICDQIYYTDLIYVTVYFIINKYDNIFNYIKKNALFNNEASYHRQLKIIDSHDPVDLMMYRIIKRCITYNVSNSLLYYNQKNIDINQYDIALELFLSMPVAYKDQLNKLDIPLKYGIY